MNDYQNALRACEKSYNFGKEQSEKTLAMIKEVIEIQNKRTAKNDLKNIFKLIFFL